jgi:hypothetical protein
VVGYHVGLNSQERRVPPINQACVGFLLAGLAILFAAYSSAHSPDAEAMFLAPVLVSPIVAAGVGYRIGKLNGYLAESIGVCLFLAAYLDAYLIIQLF